MKRYIGYELKKQLSSSKGMVWTAAITNVISLLFFSLVGRYDVSDGDLILRKVTSIMTLSVTLTLSIICIYGTILFNKFLLKDYIQQTREKTYLFPGGRTTIFISKLSSLCLIVSLSFFPIVTLENVLFYFMAHIFKISRIPFIDYGLKVFSTTSFATIFILLLIVLSILTGLYFQSTNVSIITAIILVSILGNFVAQLYQMNSIITFILIAGVISLLFGLIKVLANKIKTDDVIKI